MPAYNKSDIQRRMHGAVEALKHDLGGLRTGRASTALLDPITVEVYGAHMPLNQVLSDDLKVMDASAIALCRDNNIPIVVFNIRERGNLARVLGGEGIATIVQNEGGKNAQL